MSELGGSLSQIKSSTKIAALIGIVFSIAIVIYLSFLFLVKDYSVLYKELDDSTAASVVKGLKELKIDYKLQDGGQTVLVENDLVNEAKMSLMSEGVLTNNHVGLELFDNTDYGMTEFAQKVNFQRAMQGEIARTIMSLEEIKFARVHLTLPKTSIFANQRTQAKASITLVKEQGKYLSESQILGMQRMVASSVEELPVENVVVVDERGIDISVKGIEENQSMSEFSGNKVIARKREYEEHLYKKLDQLLKKGLGAKQYAISVDVEIDVTKTTLVSENLLTSNGNPNGYLKRKTASTKYLEGGSSKKASNSSKASEDLTNEYLFGKEVKQTEYLGGGIKSISVAVILDENITVERVEMIRQLVSASIGIDLTRGDSVQVHRLKQAHLSDGSSELVKEHVLDAATIPKTKPNTAKKRKSNYLTIGEVDLKLEYILGLVIVLVISIPAIILFAVNRKRRHKVRQEVLDDIRSWLSNGDDQFSSSSLESVGKNVKN